MLREIQEKWLSRETNVLTQKDRHMSWIHDHVRNLLGFLRDFAWVKKTGESQAGLKALEVKNGCGDLLRAEAARQPIRYVQKFDHFLVTPTFTCHKDFRRAYSDYHWLPLFRNLLDLKIEPPIILSAKWSNSTTGATIHHDMERV